MARDRKRQAKRQPGAVTAPKAGPNRRQTAQTKRVDESLARGRSGVSQAEDSVLNVFRQFLMTPGQMLCFDKADLASFSAALVQLTNNGFLVAEKFPGGYSLTEIGFAAMRKRQR